MESIVKFNNKINFDFMLGQLNDIGYINSGGCGVSALATLKWIEKFESHMLSQCVIVFGYYNFQSSIYEQNQRAIDGEENGFGVSSHIFIEIDNVPYDSHGNMNLDKWSMFHKFDLSNGMSNLMSLINEPDGYTWNKSFNRDIQVPLIESALGIDLSSVSI